jgi:hypothetical protein
MVDYLGLRFGKDSTTEFVSVLKNTVDNKFREKRSMYPTKEDKPNMIKWLFLFRLYRWLSR